MNKLICANCGRTSDLGYFEYRGKDNTIMAIVFLCEVCKGLVKSVGLSVTMDEEKIQEIKDKFKLNKGRIKKKGGSNENSNQ